jgi:D-alanine-D-alanine ligase
MVDSDVVTVASGADLRQALVRKNGSLGHPCFAEQFIEGREFNLSVVDIGDRVVVLPPAEIRFENFPEGKPRIVGSAAKWDEKSFEYAATPRSFEFPESDLPLLRDLRELAERCWISLGLAGYARVDFRIDEAGQPWILEVNANPCLSPDAGLAAAAARADLPYDDLILGILKTAIRAKAD